jgi:hypothetical protein
MRGPLGLGFAELTRSEDIGLTGPGEYIELERQDPLGQPRRPGEYMPGRPSEYRAH